MLSCSIEGFVSRIKSGSSFQVTTEPVFLEPVSQACALARKVLMNVTVSCYWFGACRSTSRNWPAWPRWGRNSSPTSRVCPTSPSCLTWPEVWHRSPQLETSFQPTEAPSAGRTDGRTERWTSFSCSSKPSFLFESQDSCSGASNHGGGDVRKRDLWNLIVGRGAEGLCQPGFFLDLDNKDSVPPAWKQFASRVFLLLVWFFLNT